MKRINFTKLSVKNFLSIGEQPVDIKFKDGMNVIRGVNRDEEDIANAAGKSSVIAAFYFAIFGESIVDLPNKFLVNRKIGKGATVRLEFEDLSSKRGEEYFVIERTISPNKCKVWKNDIEKTKSSIAETNKYILEVLNADEEIFKNCIVMRANSGASFMTKKKTERKNFIESIFALGVFSDMLRGVKEDIREIRSKFDIENTALNIMNTNVERYKVKIAEIQKQLEEQQANIRAEKEKLYAAIAKEEEKIKILKESSKTFDPSLLSETQEKIKKANGYENQLIKKMGELSGQIKAIQKQIKDIEKRGNVCPNCERPYPEDDIDRNAKLKSRLCEEAKRAHASYEELSKKQKKLHELCVNLQATADEQRKMEGEETVNKVRITSCQKTIAQYQQMIDKVEEKYAISPVDVFVSTLKETEERIVEQKEIVNEIQKELGRLNVCEFVLGEQGVRSYIVNKLLELLNGRIRYYLKSFKSTFEFTFNEVFEEVITDANGIICMYNNCSGAEQKKIDLAVAFSFLDIIKFHRQVEYNIAFYDEILDSSVDNKSLGHIVNFIAEKAIQNGKAVYIVTHKTDVMLPELTETIILEKRNGFTRRLEEH